MAMGTLIDGRWTDDEGQIKKGAFERQPSVFGDRIESRNVAAFLEMPGRFVLIASMSCPWSHRTLILRNLKGFSEYVPAQIAGGRRVQGYSVNSNTPWKLPGTSKEILHVHEIYTHSDPGYTGRASVPVLWDSFYGKIVSNDSMAIMKAFDEAVAAPGFLDFTLVPDALKKEIESLNARMHEKLANGVYRAGLAQNQDSYNSAVTDVFNMLDALEARLSDRRLLFGQTLTLSDIILFPVLVRFDAVYGTHFRCTRNRLIDYPALWAYARDLYAWRGMAELVDFDVIRAGYFLNDGSHNPFGIISIRPDADWRKAHGRTAFGPPRVMLKTGQWCKISPDTMTPAESKYP